MDNRDKIQKEAADRLYELLPGQHSRLLLAPRIGKTKIILDYIKRRTEIKTILWVTPSRQLIDVDLKNEFKTWSVSTENVTFSTWASFSKERNFGKYDLIVLDEEQKITENNSKALFTGDIEGRLIVAMTGTPTKDRKKLEIYDKLNLEVLYDVSISEAVELGVLADYKVNVVNIPYDHLDTTLNYMLKFYKPLAKYVIEEGKILFTDISSEKGAEDFKHCVEQSYDITPHTSRKGTEMSLILCNDRFLETSLKSVGYIMPDFNSGKISINSYSWKLSNGYVYPEHSNQLKTFNLIKNSSQKEQVAKELFDSLSERRIIFTSSIKQAESVCQHTYHSKTTRGNLNKFLSGKINEIAMVNAGGVGFTYKKVQDLILTQVSTDRNGDSSQKFARALLKQQNFTATIWILCLQGTVDEQWVSKFLKNFDKTKIKYLNYLT